MRDAELSRHTSGVLYSAKRTAAGALGLGRRFLPNLHRHTDDIVALLFKQRRRDAAVYAPAHGDDDSCVMLVSQNRKNLARR